MSKDWDAVARELFREVVECDAPREAFVATFKAALETAYEQGRKDEQGAEFTVCIASGESKTIRARTASDAVAQAAASQFDSLWSLGGEYVTVNGKRHQICTDETCYIYLEDA